MNLGLNVTCNSNCNRWCPRVLEVVCCCFTCTHDDDKEVPEECEKVTKVALPAILETTTIDHLMELD